MAVCVLGGGSRIVRITGLLVPFMGVTYILMALVVMALNFQMLPQVFGRIIAGAFDFRAIFGGFAGSALMEGIKRGLYSNEAGVGSAPTPRRRRTCPTQSSRAWCRCCPSLSTLCWCAPPPP